MNPQQNNEISTIKKHVLKFGIPNDIAAWRAIGVTVGYFIMTASLCYMGFTQMCILILTLNYVRFFIQFHDMAHFSFFKDMKWNIYVGRFIGIVTHFPFDAWRDGHNHHHKHFGNLDRLDLSQTILFTKAQYDSWSKGKKIFVRILRQPIIFFIISVPLLWFVGLIYVVAKRYGVFSRAFFDKFCAVSFHFVIGYIFGVEVGILSFLPPYFGCILGTILFHLQHSVNLPYRQHKQKWNFQRAALQGSTYLNIPYIFRPFTNGIEYHHIHHLNTNVASYKIQQCHYQFSKQQNKGDRWRQQGKINEVGYWLAFKSLFNVMLNEQTSQLMPFNYGF